MGSRRSTREGGLESLPSGSTELYESAEELDTASLGGSHSRGHSFSGAATRELPPPAAAASAANGLAAGTLRTCWHCLCILAQQQSPHCMNDLTTLLLPAGRRRSTDVASRASSAASERLTTDTATTPAASAAAQQLQEVSLDDPQQRGAQPPAPAERRPSAKAASGAGAGAANGSGASEEAAPTSPSSPGSSMFSVPSASAPTTGIYGIPSEMFRIRDLDAGRDFTLDQVGAELDAHAELEGSLTWQAGELCAGCRAARGRQHASGCWTGMPGAAAGAASWPRLPATPAPCQAPLVLRSMALPCSGTGSRTLTQATCMWWGRRWRRRRRPAARWRQASTAPRQAV